MRKIGELVFDRKKDMVDDMVKGPPGDIVSGSMIIPDRKRLNNIP